MLLAHKAIPGPQFRKDMNIECAKLLMKELFTKNEELFVWNRSLSSVEVQALKIKTYSMLRNEIKLSGSRNDLINLVNGSLKIYFIHDSECFQMNIKSLVDDVLICSFPEKI